jgi:hypothetical protein
MIHELIPWRTLTRTGIPPLKVSRRTLQVGEVVVGVGETLDPMIFPPGIRAERLRQFYDQRRLEPVNPPVDSRQYWREQRGRTRIPGLETPVDPVVPVASEIVASVLPVALPGLGIPVAEEARDLDRPSEPQSRGRGRPLGSNDKTKRKPKTYKTLRPGAPR